MKAFTFAALFLVLVVVPVAPATSAESLCDTVVTVQPIQHQQEWACGIADCFWYKAPSDWLANCP